MRVRFTPESGLAPADLKEVCRGQQCDIAHPWLRRAEPDIGECGARLGTYWPDRVIRSGECYVRGSNYGSVVFKADAAEKFVVYTTGDGRRELDLVQVYGVFRDGGGAAVDDNGEHLGRHGLRESLIELGPGGEERTWVRADMADDDGNVWLFAYRCEAEHGDDGCPLVDRDQVRPSYGVTERPTFVVRVSFVSAADADRSTLEAHCPPRIPHLCIDGDVPRRRRDDPAWYGGVPRGPRLVGLRPFDGAGLTTASPGGRGRKPPVSRKP